MSLVQDILGGDHAPTESELLELIARPAYVQHDGFSFGGILQSFFAKNSAEGNPIYEAVLLDPREVLACAELIIGDYNGSTFGVSNLINCFGYWENLGFGSAQANDSGMPWNLILSSLLAICNQPNQTAFGGPLNYRGITYSIDLSELPVPPIYYRMGGTGVNLLDAIAQVCEDGGRDFFVELVGRTIKIRTVSRLSEPPLGTIAAITGDYAGSAVRSNVGLEARNEVTSYVIVGGNVTTLHLTDGISSFWGYDVGNAPILGQPGTISFANPAGGTPLLTVLAEFAALNAGPVADILGATTYLCSTLEMRFALVSYESWGLFISNQKPGLAARLFIPNAIQDVARAFLANAAINDGRANVQLANAALRQSSKQLSDSAKSQRLYEFVKGYATDYYGKKFAISVPFVLLKVDGETGKVAFSQEPTDAGYLNDGDTPLGMSPLYQDNFRSQDGRFLPLALFANVQGTDLSRISFADTLLQGTSLYTKAQVDHRLVFTPAPVAILSLGSAIYEQTRDAYGDLRIIAAAFQRTKDDLDKEIRDRAGAGTLSTKIFPAARYPAFVGVPLRSNILTYGPWYSKGAPGKVKFEVDPTLTPWNYGSYSVMNLAALARASSALTYMQVSEAGAIERAGTPAVPLGGVLRAGGPNVTNVSVSIGKEGVTTSYNFATFTPRFGAFNKGLDKRLQRQGQAAQELQRSLRTALKQEAINESTREAAFRGALANLPRALRRQTPHPLLMACNVEDVDGSVRVGASTVDLDEALSCIPVPQDDDQENASRDEQAYQATAMMSLGGLVRPFAVSPAASGLIARMGQASGVLTTSPSVNTLSPFQSACDIEMFTWGDTYQGLNAYIRGADPSLARGLALRGPLLVTGWGYDIDGKIVPSSGGAPYPNYLRRSDQWRVGPVDLLWDPYRAVWTSHDIVYGMVQGGILPGQAGAITVYKGSQATVQSLAVTNRSLLPAHSGDFVLAGYLPTSNDWTLIPLSASSGSTSTTSLTVQTASGTPTLTGVDTIVLRDADAFYLAATGTAGAAIGLYDFVPSRHGLVPAPGGSGTTRFLREDGSWSFASTSSGIQVNSFSNVNTLQLASGDAFTVTQPSAGIASVGLNDFLPSGPTHKHGLVPDPGIVAGSGKFLREDGSWVTVPTGIFTYTQDGSVPHPGGSGTTRFLREDGGWSFASPSSGVQVNSFSHINTLQFSSGDAFSVTQSSAGIASVGLNDFLPSGPAHKHGLVPDPGAVAGTGKFLHEDANWVTVPTGTFTYTQDGTVPHPGGSGAVRFLREDGGWATPSSSGGIQVNSFANITSLQFASGDGVSVTESPAGRANVAIGDFLPSGPSHRHGLVPDPGSTAGATRFLREDSTWQAITSSSGTVRYVALSAPAQFSVSGSPIVDSGMITLSWVNQSSGLFLASPTSLAGIPTFRPIARSDLPIIATSDLPIEIAYTDVVNIFTQTQVISPPSGNPGLDIYPFGANAWEVRNASGVSTAYASESGHVTAPLLRAGAIGLAGIVAFSNGLVGAELCFQAPSALAGSDNLTCILPSNVPASGNALSVLSYDSPSNTATLEWGEGFGNFDNIVTGSGNLNTIPLWTPDGDTLGNSLLTQPAAHTVRLDASWDLYRLSDTVFEVNANTAIPGNKGFSSIFDDGNSRLQLDNTASDAKFSVKRGGGADRDGVDTTLADGSAVYGGLVTGTGGTVSVPKGGTGQTTLTNNAVLVGGGTSPVGFVPVGTAGNLLADQGVGSNPAFQSLSSLLDAAGGITGIF